MNQLLHFIQQDHLDNYFAALILVITLLTLIQIIVGVTVMLKFRKRINIMAKQMTNIENSFVNFLMELDAKNTRLKNKNDELKTENTKLKKPH